MKTLFLTILFFVFCLSRASAQFKKDYFVPLKGDTVFAIINKFSPGSKKMVVRINDKKVKIKTDSLMAVCYMMIEYESVMIDSNWKFMYRMHNGVINLYQEEIIKGGGGKYPVTIVKYYIKTGDGIRGPALPLNKENLKNLATECRPLMDSLLNDWPKWYTDKEDIVYAYNKLCGSRNK